MTRDEHRPAGPAEDGPRDPRQPASDAHAPVIDPQDPLGLGDLTRDDPTRDDLPRDDEPADGAGAADGDGAGGDGTAVAAAGVDGDAADGEAADGEAADGEAAGDEPAPDVPEGGTAEGDAIRDEAAAPPVPDDASDQPPSDGSPVPPAQRGPDEDLAPVGGAHEHSSAPGHPEAAPAGRSAWSRLRHAMHPRITSGQLLTAALCALLGLALVVQVRQTTDAQLGSLRQDDLVRLLDETTTRADELAREAADLQRERDELLSGSDRQQAALDAARRNAATQGILTGRLPATGPGVHVTLHESEPGIKPATMLHVLEELRNAGAEAVQLNDMRVTASSAFTGTAGAIVLDGVTLSPPYRWVVIGDPDTIATALEIPGGAMATVRRDGGRGTVDRLERVDVTALRQLPDPVHATPVPDAG